MLEAVAFGTRMLDNVRFEGLGGSRSISSDELCRPEGEKAVRLGLDNHTSRSPNVSLTACVVSCVVLLCNTIHVLSTRHSLCMQYVTNPRDDWSSRVDRTMAAHMGE